MGFLSRSLSTRLITLWGFKGWCAVRTLHTIALWGFVRFGFVRFGDFAIQLKNSIALAIRSVDPTRLSPSLSSQLIAIHSFDRTLGL